MFATYFYNLTNHVGDLCNSIGAIVVAVLTGK